MTTINIDIVSTCENRSKVGGMKLTRIDNIYSAEFTPSYIGINEKITLSAGTITEIMDKLVVSLDELALRHGLSVKKCEPDSMEKKQYEIKELIDELAAKGAYNS